MDQLFTDPAFYGLGLGIGGPILGLYLKGYLPTPTERKMLREDSLKKDTVIAEKDAYIRKLVADMQEQNDAIRNTVVPTLNTIMQEILRGKTNG